MNDKIKQLLENAEQSDAIAKNKWRIENREQLREQRKKELKELMEKDKTMSNNKQQTPDKNYWLITINSWGTHLLYGTEEEAEDFRKHKCRWEQSIGTKRIANNEEILTYGGGKQ
jgi:hypothetical protein